MQIKIDDLELRSLLSRLADVDYKPLFGQIAETVMPEHEKRWAAGQAPDGTGWEELKKGTLAAKSKRGETQMLMSKDKTMLGHGLVSRVSDTQLELGLNDKKAPWHHGGTSRGLPARPLVGLSDADLEKVGLLAVDFLDNLLER